jgi:hypothetical protein
MIEELNDVAGRPEAFGRHGLDGAHVVAAAIERHRRPEQDDRPCAPVAQFFGKAGDTRLRIGIALDIEALERRAARRELDGVAVKRLALRRDMVAGWRGYQPDFRAHAAFGHRQSSSTPADGPVARPQFHR